MESLSLDDAVRWVRRQVQEGPLPSAVFGVATSAGTQVIEAFSGSDARAARIDDHYALYSVSKPLSGIALARSVERGELSLRSTLASAFPGSADAPASSPESRYAWRGGVRLEQLMSHTGGLVDPALDDPRGLDEQLSRAAQDFAPGTMTKYSNIAFHGAARILNEATGRDIHDEIEALGSFGAGAGQLTFDPASDPHHVYGQERVGFDHDAMARNRHPASGVNGTAEGLLALGSSVLRALGGARGEVLHPQTIAGMLLPRTTGLPEPVPSDPRRDFGLTWNLRHDSSALLHRNAFGHEGWSTTQWWIYPQLDLSFVLLTNLLDARGVGVDPDELNNAVVAGS